MIVLDNLKDPIDISIPLQFNGPQPNAYGVDPAASKACEAGDLIGDTRRGGSVNFEQYTFIPHCNGTHTECVGHITHERISVRDCLKDVFMPALLVSVESEPRDVDSVISLSVLRSAGVEPHAAPTTPAFGHPSSGRRGVGGSDALIVRTIPNDNSKLSRQYGENNIPPYFTTEAVEYIVECGFKHLLVDMPSIDRLFDQGKLLNHRIFWNVEPGSFETHADTRIYSTITELIYVPNEVEDGEYLLNLQIAPFASDAAPCRPIIFKKN